MKRPDTLTSGQLSALIFVSTLSPAMRLLPWRLAATAGRGVWLSVLLAAAPLGLLWGVCHILLKRRLPGEGLGGLLRRGLGRRLGTVICIIYMVWLPVYAGFLLRSAAERLVAVVYDLGSPALFGVLLLALAGLAAFGRTRALGRTAQVVGELLLLVLGLVALLLAPSVKPGNLFPPEDWGGVLRGAAPGYDVGSAFVYLLFLAGSMEEGPGTRRLARGSLAGLGVGGLLAALTVGALSPRVAAGAENPFFVAIRDLSLFGFVERVESVVIALWVLTDFVYLAAILAAGARLLSELSPPRPPRSFAPLLLAAAGAAAVLIARDAFALRELSRGLVPAVSMALTTLPPAAAAAGLSLKKFFKNGKLMLDNHKGAWYIGGAP